MEHKTYPYQLSLLIPCYNEAGRIHLMMTALHEFQQKAKFNFEVIVIDDGSTDGTATKITEDKLYSALNAQGNFKIITADKNKGKASALALGVEAAQGAFILTLDADMSAKPTTLLDWLKGNDNLFQQNDIYIASRRHKETQEEALPKRRFLGKVYGRAVQLLTPIDVLDTQCGFKLYPAEHAKSLFAELQCKGWAHDVDLLYNAHNKGVVIHQMPLSWKNAEGSKVKVYADGIKMFFEVLLIAIRRGFQNMFIVPFKNFSSSKNMAVLSKPLFNVLSWLLIFAMPIMSRRFGITGDEHIHRKYGRQIFDYFFNGDDTATIMDEKTTIQLYGGLYDFISTCLAHIFPNIPPYQISHYLNSFIGALGIIFVGKIVHLFTKNYWWSVLAMLLVVFSPSFFGQTFNNPKDIPFAAFYTIAVYYISCTLLEFPDYKFKTLFKLSIALGLGMGVRIGGLLLMCYLGLFVFIQWILAKPKPSFIKLASRLFVVVLFAYIIGILFWPWAHQSIIGNPIEALTSFSNYTAVGIGMLFKGATISSSETPQDYILHYISHTAPLFVLISAALFFVGLLLKNTFSNKLVAALLPFVVVFPVAFAIYKNSQLYDGWRHFLFVYPSIVVLATLGLWSVYKISPKIMQFVVPVLALVGMAMPIKFTMANHPFESVYFNELSGGVKGAYGNYEMDYYQNASKACFDWLIKNKGQEFANAKDTVIIATNMTNSLLELNEEAGLKTQILYVRYYQKNQKNWDYAILNSRFLSRDQLLNGYFPGSGSKIIYTAKADDVPLCVVVKNEPEKYAYNGFRLMQEGKSDSALLYFKNAFSLDNKDQEVLSAMAEIYAQQGKADSASIYVEKAIAISGNDFKTLMNAGDIYLKAGKLDKAQTLFMNMINANDQNSAYGYLGLAQIQMAQKQFDAAIQNANNAMQANPQLGGNAYQLLAYIYQQKGDMATAQKYMQALQGGR